MGIRFWIVAGVAAGLAILGFIRATFGGEPDEGVGIFAIGCLVEMLLFELRNERKGASSGESTGELGENGQVGVKPDPLKATDSQRQ
jgi:hypothetical protein